MKRTPEMYKSCAEKEFSDRHLALTHEGRHCASTVSLSLLEEWFSLGHVLPPNSFRSMKAMKYGLTVHVATLEHAKHGK